MYSILFLIGFNFYLLFYNFYILLSSHVYYNKKNLVMYIIIHAHLVLIIATHSFFFFWSSERLGFWEYQGD